MKGDDNPLSLCPFQAMVVGGDGFFKHLVRVLAKIAQMLPPARVDVVAVPRGVHLDVLNPRFGQCGDFRADYFSNLPQQVGAAGVERVRDAGLEREGGKLVGAGKGHLYGTRGMLQQERQLISGQTAYLPQFCAHDMPHSRFRWLLARPLPDSDNCR